MLQDSGTVGYSYDDNLTHNNNFMNNIFENFILWLDGKKSYISAITLLLVPFLVSQGAITKEWGELIMGIVAILVGGGKIYTSSSISNGTPLGAKILNKRK